MTAATAHFHHAFGLSIRSALPLPEARPAVDTDAPEIAIEYGQVPRELAAPRVCAARFQAGPGEFLLRVDGVARYFVQDGRRIVIERESDSDDDVRAFLLTSAWGALLHQRGDLVLQGSAMATDAGGVALLGLPGAGKSTLALALQRRGYPLLTDELCVVRPEAGGRALLLPGFSGVRLWPDALHALGLEAERFPRVRPAIEKRAVSLGASMVAEPRPLRRAYLLSAAAGGEDITLTPADASRRLNILQNHAFHPRWVDGLDVRPRFFQHVLTLAPHLPITVVARPEAPFRLAELVDRIAAELAA